MAHVYMLRGSCGRYYIGATDNFDRRFSEHQRGSNHTTRRLGRPLELVAKRGFHSMIEARAFERRLKGFKNPELAISHLQRLGMIKESSPE
jgi:predicted GIY-YIG superfamily endonuclease